jgi:hypothetical protein
LAFSETSSQLTPPSSRESANHRFLAARCTRSRTRLARGRDKANANSQLFSDASELLLRYSAGDFCRTLPLPLRVRLGRVSLSRACHPHSLPVPPLVWHRLFFHRERTTARTSETFPPRPAFCGRPAARRIRFSWHSGSSIRSARRFPGLTARIGIPSLSRVWPMSG